jgi:phosphoglycolate phosphatase
MTYRYLILDLDGTVADPSVAITTAIRRTLETLGVAAPPEDDLRWCIGPPLRQYFPKLLKSNDPLLTEEAVALYRKFYAEPDPGLSDHLPLYLAGNAIYPGMPPVLDALRAAGFELFIASSKARPFLQPILEHAGLAHHFRGVYGPELDGRFDNKAKLIQHLLVHERIPIHQTALAGDRSTDIEAALISRMTAIGVTWGFGSRRELERAKPDAIVDSPGELFEVLTT